MSQHYSDPEQELSPTSLPDVEVWEDYISIVHSRCGDFKVGRESESARGFCPSCDRATCVDEVETTEKTGWFWWTCLPGCLPDSDPYGPFASEAEALADARERNDL